jgi:uncharacterized phiE125 gp8 family phage protein
MTSFSHRLVETAPPGAEPVTLEEAKAHLRVDSDAENAYIAELIAAVRQFCESYTGRAFVVRSYSLYLDAWPDAAVALPRPPLHSVESVQVYAGDDTAEEFSAGGYYADTVSFPGRLLLREGAFAPAPGRAVNGIEIRYRAGYSAAPESVPSVLRQGMKQMIAYLYQNRGDGPERALGASGAGALFQPYRMVGL